MFTVREKSSLTGSTSKRPNIRRDLVIEGGTRNPYGVGEVKYGGGKQWVSGKKGGGDSAKALGTSIQGKGALVTKLAEIQGNGTEVKGKEGKAVTRRSKKGKEGRGGDYTYKSRRPRERRLRWHGESSRAIVLQ